MPQVFALALIGAGAFAGYRWISRQLDAIAKAANQAEAELRRATESAAQPKDLGQLEWDAASGVYRPRANV
jgi:hypothetical protein